jgi:hypothetical protein
VVVLHLQLLVVLYHQLLVVLHHQLVVVLHHQLEVVPGAVREKSRDPVEGSKGWSFYNKYFTSSGGSREGSFVFYRSSGVILYYSIDAQDGSKTSP